MNSNCAIRRTTLTYSSVTQQLRSLLQTSALLLPSVLMTAQYQFGKLSPLGQLSWPKRFSSDKLWTLAGKTLTGHVSVAITLHRSWDGLTLYAVSSDGTLGAFSFDSEELEGIAPHSVQQQYLQKFGFTLPPLPEGWSHTNVQVTSSGQRMTPPPSPNRTSHHQQGMNGFGAPSTGTHEIVNTLIAKRNTKKRAQQTFLGPLGSLNASGAHTSHRGSPSYAHSRNAVEVAASDAVYVCGPPISHITLLTSKLLPICPGAPAHPWQREHCWQGIWCTQEQKEGIHGQCQSHLKEVWSNDWHFTWFSCRDGATQGKVERGTSAVWGGAVAAMWFIIYFWMQM